jgi:class 3 adenylate cyclase
MALVDDISKDVDGVLSEPWALRDGEVVPATANVALAGGGVKLDATMLYADLADSTEIAMWDRRVAARLCKAFLACSSRLIRAQGGEVRSCDGDRVMDVFLGNTKNTSAAKCALEVNWTFLKVIKPKFEANYESLRDGTHKLAHCTGVDTSEVLVVRAGIRNNNDLIWIGSAPNVAAKMSAFREAPYFSFITGAVYDKLADEAKLSNGTNMWEERSWKAGPIQRVFRSSWTWSRMVKKLKRPRIW